MMITRTMYVAVRQLFAAGDAHVRHNAGEDQRLAGQRMVAVDRHAFVADAGDGVDPAFARVFPTAIELHAHLDAGWKQSAWLDAHQRGLVSAKRILGLELNAARVA